MLINDPEKQAERLLRRMKRDFRYRLTIGDQSMSAGYGTYFLNASFLSKRAAKEWIVEKMEEFINVQKPICFQRVEERHMVIPTQMVVYYEADVYDGMTSTNFRIMSDAGKWKIWKNKMPPILWSGREAYETAEEAMAVIQEKTDQSIQHYLNAFK